MKNALFTHWKTTLAAAAVATLLHFTQVPDARHAAFQILIFFWGAVMRDFDK